MGDRTQIWNFGGGTQSNAIAALIIAGVLPKPDLAVISDTGREMSTTWLYMDTYTAPALRQVGVEIHRVKKEDFATVDLYSGKDSDTLLIPAFTSQGSETGKLPAYCSTEWKKRVVERWATKVHGVKSACNWIGFSTDEHQRAKSLGGGKWTKWYPLIEKGISRNECYGIVRRMGWPQPPRSSCWMCPNHREDEWAWQKENAPGDFIKAVEFEREIQARDTHAWLHHEVKPLDQVEFDSKNDVMFGGCKSGMCFT